MISTRLSHYLRLFGILLVSCGVSRGAVVAPKQEVEQLRVMVLSRRPHDTEAFTQGVLIDESAGDVSRCFESTGLYGRSTLREVDLQSGAVLRSVSLPGAFFGEGLALVGERLIQLTWREGVAPVYDRDTFERIGAFSYSGEGWGLCYDGSRLIMSDGSAHLSFRSPETFALLGRVEVTLGGVPQGSLNELEYVGGYVYANVWFADSILKIDPANGRVAAVIDASGLLSAEERLQANVLNGIAYSEKKGTFFITGKLWPAVFEVAFVPRGEPFARGDANADARVDISDAVFLLRHLFGGRPEPACVDAGDADDSGSLDLADAVCLVGHLFSEAGPLPEPSGACGADPTPDQLDCEIYSPCVSVDR